MYIIPLGPSNEVKFNLACTEKGLKVYTAFPV